MVYYDVLFVSDVESGNNCMMSNSIKSFILENDNKNIMKLHSKNITCLHLLRFDIFSSSFSNMKLLILSFIMSCFTFRCSTFVVKKHLFVSKIFLFNPTRRTVVAIITA